jgi:hypothetical protein
MEVLGEEFGHPTSEGHVDVPRSTQLKKFLLVLAGRYFWNYSRLNF